MLRTSQNALTLLVECRFWYSVCSKYKITDTHAQLTEKVFFSFIFSCYEGRFKSTFADKYQNRVVCQLSISALIPLSNSSSSLTVNLNIFPITLFVNPYPTPHFASSLFFCQSLCQHTFVIDGIKHGHSILMNHLL